jgi:hypothetical protein
MFIHPDLLVIVARQHMKELSDAAAEDRLAASASRGRRRRWPGRHRAESNLV